ncbi:MAG: TIGR04211 family SH3 domain-containing protein [Sedimenticola sp.]|nr:TIGR04211 family SH3 domain-containing protein [Sedimenticola sp.]
MKRLIQKGGMVLLLSLLVFSLAEAARITDKLLAGLYEKPEVSATPLRVLPSDTPLERLEKEGEFTRVRLGDGTEGWVESRFITDEKPARIMLLELQVKNSELQQKLREANKSLKALGQDAEGSDNAPDPEIVELKRQLADARAEIELLKRETSTEPTPQSQDDTVELKQQITELQQALQEAKESAREQAKPTGDDTALQALQQTNQQLQQQLDQIAGIVGAPQVSAAEAPAAEPAGIRFNAWHLPVLLLALLFSFIGGVAFKNYRLAKRYGGFRI